jgi:hypothetical protein
MDDKVSRPNPIRRKVVQGGLAAPVVLTVSSASAQSVSSFGRCLANLNNQPTGPFFIKDADLSLDNWLRAQVPVVQLKKGSDIDWFYNDPGRMLYVRLSDPLGPGLNPLDMNGWQEWDKSTRWALVWVDSQNGGTYKDVRVQKPLNYQATTKSCYTSLMKG